MNSNDPKKYGKPRQAQIFDRAYNRVTKVTEVNKTGATYARLLTGEWGLRATGDVFPGMKIKVERRDGTLKTEIVGKIREKKGEYYYCEIKKVNSSKGSRITLPSKPIPPDDGTVPF